MTYCETLPALPGGVGALSDRLAALSKRIAETGDLLADYRAMRPIEKAHTMACLQLQIILMEQGYGKGNA